MTETQEAIEMLKRARARYKGPESVVTNFHNLFEDAQGNRIWGSDAEFDFKQHGIEPARMCLVASLILNSDEDIYSKAGNIYSKAANALEAAAKRDNKSVMGDYHFTLTEILHYYDIAIEMVEREGKSA